MILQLYTPLVTPHLEYAIQAWLVATSQEGHHRKDIDFIEKFLRRAIKMCNSNSLLHLSYGQRVSHLKLTTLETRRLRGDMIYVCKMLKLM